MERIFKSEIIYESFIKLLPSLNVTLLITVVSILIGMILGLIIALLRIKKIPIFYQLATIYVSFMRGTPLLVQLFLSFYGIPLLLELLNAKYHLNLSVNNIPTLVFVFVAFSLNEAAYNSEAIRAAILSVDKKDIDAAYSLGMNNGQLMRRVIIPQAMIVAIPNLGNSLVSLVKSTSLAFTIGVLDVTGATKVIAGSNMHFFETYIAAALIYWIVCIIIEVALKRLESKFNILEKGVDTSV
ncbi:amino acid ABC transporter permease [Clostridium ljungdahlii]|uniref:L-cystine transport system permease protein TcyL n=1 Tax=Clostridium ljungdahlii TaxID=1538 RepID=A0A168M0L4_9CLOT|nr:amino acid ABC transporter permease [Clostridium ljungdahlii]OAA83949.1 L-cystine transport system permease protein TcyL [Clostridium ljungdahlii]